MRCVILFSSAKFHGLSCTANFFPFRSIYKGPRALFLTAAIFIVSIPPRVARRKKRKCMGARKPVTRSSSSRSGCVSDRALRLLFLLIIILANILKIFSQHELVPQNVDQQFEPKEMKRLKRKKKSVHDPPPGNRFVGCRARLRHLP